VIHVVTVHWRRDEWIDRQLSSIHRYAPGARTWASLDYIDPQHFSKFDHAWSLETADLGLGLEPYASTSDDPDGDRHGLKLNELARRVMEVAEDDDIIVFLDGDALLLAPLDQVIERMDRLAAVRRDENDGDMFPHPSLLVTRVATWRELGGDWRRGEFLTNANGRTMTDTGTRLVALLRDKQWSWSALTRINKVNLHPVWFGIYGSQEFGPVVYHHGAGFRTRVSRLDLARNDKRRWFQLRSFDDRQAALDKRVQRWIDRAPTTWWQRRFMA
jgi:hypothetical protein